MNQLKLCPFCGEQARVIASHHPRLYRPSRNGNYYVVCDSCDALLGFDEDYGGQFDTEEEAIEAWNRRECAE